MLSSTSEITSIGHVVNQVMREAPYAHRWEAGAVVYAWRTVVPPFIAKWIDKTYFKEGKLFVHSSSGAVRQELRAAKSDLLMRLQAACANTLAAQDAIVDIVFL